MKRIKITETQRNMLKAKINESLSKKYSREVKLNIYENGVKYKGYEIRDISSPIINLSFSIEFEFRSIGISDVYFTNIQGPSEVSVDVVYLDGKEEKTEQIVMGLDWEKVILNTEKGHGILTIDNYIDIVLVNGSDGGLLIKGIELSVFGI